MVILDNRSLFFKYHIASNVLMLPASYIKTIDAYIDYLLDTLKLFNTLTQVLPQCVIVWVSYCIILINSR